MAAKQFKPQFFVTRQNGAMIPLIAMDELPIHVQIQGVSRSLSAFETAGMTGVGTMESRHQFYVVDSMNNSKTIVPPVSEPTSATDSATSTPVLTPVDIGSPAPRKLTFADLDPTRVMSGKPVSLSSVASEGDEIKPGHAKSANTVPEATPEVKIPAPTIATPLEWRSKIASPPSAVANTAFTEKSCPEIDWNPEMPPPGQKVYCAFWLKNGECSFTQTGCLFKHVMPLNIQVLEALGLRDLPDWFRKQTQCGSLRINGGRNGLSFGITPQNIEGLGNATGPRARVDAEASRRTIASQVNAIPVRGSRPANNRQVHTGNARPIGLNTPRIPRVQTDAEKALERERRNERMTRAFEADLMSNCCSEMMDEQQQAFRDKEQAGWDEELKARQSVAATRAQKVEKKVNASGSDSAGKEGKKHAQGGPRRKVIKA